MSNTTTVIVAIIAAALVLIALLIVFRRTLKNVWVKVKGVGELNASTHQVSTSANLNKSALGPRTEVMVAGEKTQLVAEELKTASDVKVTIKGS